MTVAHKLFHVIAGVVFLVLAIIHAFRVLYGWYAIIGGLVVPLWLSGVGVLLALYMAYWSLKTMQ